MRLSIPMIIAIMGIGYLLVMGALALGLRLRRRQPGPPPARRRGWPGLIRQVAGTAVGGYLLLMAVVFGYYYGVAGLGGDFLMSAVSGSAGLLGMVLPAYLAVSWLVERARRRRAARARRPIRR
ncbi:DUF6256 family protein [Streptomyces litchfieldiae]|uniref:DUF6256 family protein n=1 Tax=Streptomyces litchfieldiae TaxID=3075543 RepID=A0ABU2MM53_9ACTN|nr:DUF6256 family protein [Streptomyces sp. DSM 44938]MDT0341724.1 DUF6256 family protein [Streptomyces sp. DSM 44938]